MGLQQKIFLVFFVPLSFWFHTFIFLWHHRFIINFFFLFLHHKLLPHFFSLMVYITIFKSDGLQHNFSLFFFTTIFAIGLIDGIILFFHTF